MAQQPQQARPATQNSASTTPPPRPKILRIGVILGGKIVEERLIRNRENVTIGQSAKNTFAIPAAELPKTWPLFQIVGGKYALNVAESMDGRLSDGGQVFALAQAKSLPNVQKTGTGWQLPLSDTARGKIILGDMTLLFQFVMAPPLQPKPQLPHSVRGTLADRIDPYMAVVLAVSFISHGAFGLYVYNMDMPAELPPDEIPDRFAKAIMEKPKLPESPKKKDDGAGAQAKADKAKEKAKGDGEDSPKKKSKGGADDAPVAAGPAVAEAPAVPQAQNTAVLKVLGARSAAGTGRFVDVTGGKDAGGDLDKGLTNVGKSGTAVALSGSGGLGGGARTSGSGEIGTIKGTGVAGPSGGGSVGGSKVEQEIKVEGRAEKIEDIDSGGLDPDKVMSTIKSRYFAGVTQCYKQGLKANPKMGGRIEVNFSVGAAGNVTKVNVSGFDDAVDKCISGMARGWRFDKPEGGSAEFLIPFVLRPGS